MQPGTQPDDIHKILSRFSHWAGEQTGNGNGHRKALGGLGADVREIPYEEAVRLVRNRGGGARVAAARPAIENPPPVAAQKPAAEPIPAPASNTALESKVRSTEKSLRRALGRAPATKKTAKIAKAVTPTPKPKKHPTEPKRKTHAAPEQEFRQVLAKTVRKAKPAVKPAVRKEKGRDQRVSVRLSRAEEHRLQTCAAKAGVTVSEYLRMCALETETATSVSRANATAANRHGKAIVAATSEAVRRPRSGLGDWLTLLRNRFLASPARFAERA